MMPTERGNALLRGSQLQGGRYVIEGTLGAGGFGITYRASDTKLRRTVAIKELYPGGSARQGNTVTVPTGYTEVHWHKVVTDFIHEAETLASLNHLAIVTVHDYFEENGTAYMVMRFIDGMNLAQRMKQNGGPLPENEVLHYARQLGAALAVIHSRGLLHRDIKPSNIMLDQRGQATLVDFGAAREFVTEQAMSQTVMATRGFAPPEQFNPKAPRGPFTDIYALAATCYYLLTGSLPNTDPTADKRLRPQLRAALDHAMASNPQQRPKDIVSFVAELRKGAKSASDTSTRGATSGQPIDRPTPLPSRRRSSPLPLIAAILTILVLLVALAWLALGSQPGGGTTTPPLAQSLTVTPTALVALNGGEPTSDSSDSSVSLSFDVTPLTIAAGPVTPLPAPQITAPQAGQVFHEADAVTLAWNDSSLNQGEDYLVQIVAGATAAVKVADTKYPLPRTYYNQGNVNGEICWSVQREKDGVGVSNASQPACFTWLPAAATVTLVSVATVTPSAAVAANTPRPVSPPIATHRPHPPTSTQPRPTNTAIPTSAPPPTAQPTSSPSPTNTPMPPATNTSVPPSPTHLPPTNTAVPPTNTPRPRIRPTPRPTSTPIPIPTPIPSPI